MITLLHKRLLQDFLYDCFRSTEVVFEGKVEKILKGNQDSIPSPSPLVKIKIMCDKFCLNTSSKLFRQ